MLLGPCSLRNPLLLLGEVRHRHSHSLLAAVVPAELEAEVSVAGGLLIRVAELDDVTAASGPGEDSSSLGAAL